MGDLFTDIVHATTTMDRALREWVDGDKDYRGFPCGLWDGKFGAWDCQPTHWKPLPPPPDDKT